MLVRLSTKGQLVLPSAVRSRHGWGPGTEFDLEDRGDVVVLRPRVSTGVGGIADLVGILEYDGPQRSIEEIDAAVAAAARKRR